MSYDCQLQYLEKNVRNENLFTIDVIQLICFLESNIYKHQKFHPKHELICFRYTTRF